MRIKRRSTGKPRRTSRGDPARTEEEQVRYYFDRIRMEQDDSGYGREEENWAEAERMVRGEHQELESNVSEHDVSLSNAAFGLQLAQRLVEQTETDRLALSPNRTGRLRGAAMDTKFGTDIDPDTASVRSLDSAMDRYEIFHDKKPIRVAELAHDVPTTWNLAGDALAVMYRTDKWHTDGDDEDYKHLHDAGDDKPYPVNQGVKLYEPAPHGKRLPVARPDSVVLLGYCLGVFARREDGETYEANPRGCYLFSSPSGNLLLLYSPNKQPDGSSGFLAAMAGGKLRVLKDGIDG